VIYLILKTDSKLSNNGTIIFSVLQDEKLSYFAISVIENKIAFVLF